MTRDLGFLWPVVGGLLVLYLPTFHSPANGLWNSETQAHDPIFLVVALLFLYALDSLLGLFIKTGLRSSAA